MIRFDTDGSERMIIDNLGKVGIGITAPETQLHAKGGLLFRSLSSATAFTPASGGVADGGSIFTLYNASSPYLVISDRIDPVFLRFQQVGDGDELTPDHSVYFEMEDEANGLGFMNGDFGVGTNTPSSRLHVYEATGTAPTSTTGSLVIEHGDDGGTSSIVFPSRVNRTSDYAYISYSDDGSGNGSTNENSLLTIGVADDYSDDFYQDDIALMPSGHVGIGTTTPLASLHISEGTDGDAFLILEADTDDSNEENNPGILFIQDGGILNASIQMEGNNNGTIATGTEANALVIENSADGATEAQIQFATEGAVRMTIDEFGFVGINDNTPEEELDVNGTIIGALPQIAFDWTRDDFSDISDGDVQGIMVASVPSTNQVFVRRTNDYSSTQIGDMDDEVDWSAWVSLGAPSITGYIMDLDVKIKKGVSNDSDNFGAIIVVRYSTGAIFLAVTNGENLSDTALTVTGNWIGWTWFTNPGM
jgi:hypothetical protein